ncbi:MAG: hypothetical protein HYV45_01865 [Candidatus Moranbacteria bacterium]|nr:hypothetical protein [Candidatus Moranbacteria bacterium]
MENPNLLKNFPGLGTAPEILATKERTKKRTGENIGGNYEALVQNYLDRLSEFVEHLSGFKEGAAKKRAVEKIKSIILDKQITRYENIPENYWREKDERGNRGSFFREIYEQGLSGDWNEMSEKEKEKYKRQHAEVLIEDQRGSLEEWIDYFSDNNLSGDIPMYLKYWVMRSILGLQEYEKPKNGDAREGKRAPEETKANGQFPRRSKNSLKKFPDLNAEALRYVVEALRGKYEGREHEFGYDIQKDERTRFQQYLKQESFAKLYAWAMESFNPIPEELLPITDGQWVMYPQGSDVNEVVKKLKGKGTGLCIAGKGAAQEYLSAGNLHVYYSNDEEGNPVFPRIALHAKGDKIAEMRGIAYKQNIDPYVIDIASAKCAEFQNGKEYEEKSRDMKRLTEIEEKTRKNQSLTKEELNFLYEIDGPINFFGMRKDPRIAELRKDRNVEEDMLTIFECTKDQIAHVPSEINENTKAYVGQLEPGIFGKLPDTLEHIYTTFPEKKIRRESVEVGGKSAQELIRELVAAGINIGSYAQSMLENRKEFIPTPESEEMTLIRLTVADLGFRTSATIEKIYERAADLGLELVPPDAGPHYRLKYQNQPLGEWIYMGMKQITGSDGRPGVFGLVRGGGGLWLSGIWARPGDEWSPDIEFVFRLRKSES